MTAPAMIEGVRAKPAGIMARPYRITTLGIVFTITLLAFEYMAVGTAMPVVARDLDGLSLYAWAFSGPLIASLIANVVAGVWADARGPAAPMFTALAILVVGLVAAGAASSMGLFVAGRVIQGAGVTIVPIYVVIARVYPAELRPKVFAATSAAWVVPSLVGPAVAGLVAEHVHWRLVFLGLIPLVVPAVLMLVPALRRAGGGEPDRAAAPGRRILAALAMAGGAAAVLYAIDRPAWSAVVGALAVLGIAGLGAGLPRLLPRGTLRLRRGLPATVALRGLLAGAFFGTETFIPLALTSLRGFTPTAAGLVLTAGALGWSTGSWYQGRGGRAHTTLVLAGAGGLAAGILGVVPAVQSTALLTVPAWIIAGLGMGLAFSSVSVLVMDYSTAAEQGGNSAALQIVDTLCAALAAGVGGAIITGFGTSRLASGLAVSGLLMAAIGAMAVVAAHRVKEQ
jgi:MFS family permease